MPSAGRRESGVFSSSLATPPGAAGCKLTYHLASCGSRARGQLGVGGLVAALELVLGAHELVQLRVLEHERRVELLSLLALRAVC